MRAIRTYLEMADGAEFVPAFAADPGVEVVPEPLPTAGLYRELTRRVGEAFNWARRWEWPEDRIMTHLGRDDVRLFVARRDGNLAGFFELHGPDKDGAVELYLFGLVAEECGKGLGKHLLSCAVRDAWAMGAKRFWLHTCSLDSPRAIPNYLARGFKVTRTEEYEETFPSEP